MFIFGSLLAILLGATTLTLQIYSLKARNPFFVKASKRLLLLSLGIVFIPTLLLCYVQEDYGKLVIASEQAKKERLKEEGKYISDTTLRWKSGVATDNAKLNNITSVIKSRLQRAGYEQYIVKSGFDRISAYTTLSAPPHSSIDPSKLHVLLTEAVTPTLELKPKQYVHTHQPFDNYFDNYDEILSVRSVHPGQERMASSGYPEAPNGYARTPWNDGFVYISKNFHINNSHINHAVRYNNNDILLTLTPEGLERMQRMAHSLSQVQMQVAVLYKGKVRGVFDPQICGSDQLVITDIPETPQQIELDADLLSEPKGFSDVESTHYGFSYPQIDYKSPFPQSIYTLLASDPYDKLWVILYAVLLLMVSGGLWYLHVKTKPAANNGLF